VNKRDSDNLAQIAAITKYKHDLVSAVVTLFCRLVIVGTILGFIASAFSV